MVEESLCHLAVAFVELRQSGEAARRVVDQKLLVDGVHQVLCGRRLEVQACSITTKNNKAIGESQINKANYLAPRKKS